jgi:uncharacterized DUF497 family protein
MARQIQLSHSICVTRLVGEAIWHCRYISGEAVKRNAFAQAATQKGVGLAPPERGRSPALNCETNPIWQAAVLDLTTLKAYIGQCFSSGTKPRAAALSKNEVLASNMQLASSWVPHWSDRTIVASTVKSACRRLVQVSDDVLFVVYTDRDDIRHIISARLASRKERRLWQSFAERWKTSAE